MWMYFQGNLSTEGEERGEYVYCDVLVPIQGDKNNLSFRNQGYHWQCGCINNSLHLCAKICSDICLRTLSVLRREQFSERCSSMQNIRVEDYNVVYL